MLIENNLPRGDLPLTSKGEIRLPPDVKLLLATINAKPGTTLAATVESASQLTSEQRLFILEHKLRENASNKVQQDLWRKLLENPTLRHVKLIAQQNVVDALSTAAFTKHQPVTVMITRSGLTLIDAELVEQSAKRIKTPMLNTTYQKSRGSLSAPTTRAGDSEQVMQKPTGTQNSASASLQQALTRALPIAKTPDTLLNAMTAIADHIRGIPLKDAPQQARALMTLIRTIAATPAISAQDASKISASELRAILTHSGITHEQTNIGRVRSQLNNLPPGNSNSRPGHGQTGSVPSSTPNRAAAGDPLTTNLKAQLIQLLQVVPTLNVLPGTVKKPSEQDVVSKLITAILQALIPGKSRASGESAALKLQQLAEQSLARIQFQQFRSLLDSSHQDTGTTRASNLHLDLPVKTPEGYVTIPLHLTEFKIRDKPKQEGATTKDDKKKRQNCWKVYFELELGQDGTLAVELKVSPDLLDATLWADKQTLRDRANEHIKSLEDELKGLGMTVCDLRCSALAPPKHNIQLDHSLVDICT